MKTEANISTTALHALQITALYKVAFNRLPDAEGLAWWMKDMANGQTLSQVANSFAPHIPAFGYASIEQTIDTFSMNAFGHEARDDVQNHWQIMALHAVPSHALLGQMALELVGQQIESWAYPVV